MRYLPLTQKERCHMLEDMGYNSIVELYYDATGISPDTYGIHGEESSQKPLCEIEVERHIKTLSSKNISSSDVPSFLGGGMYRHHVPATVDHIIQRSEFLTTYTPYQPEMAQGTLQTLFEFQSQVAILSAMDIANASLYDGAISCAEATLMAVRITGRDKVLLSGNLHPHYVAVTEALCTPLGIEVMTTEPEIADDTSFLCTMLTKDLAAIVTQTPDVWGQIYPRFALSQKCKEHACLMIGITTEVISWGILQSPGNYGVDIVAAEGQSLGNSLNYGGPSLGLLACKKTFMRHMPGRLCGESVDAHGRRSFTLTMTAREQHIRRHKATSNVCTNSGLCSLAFSIHACLLGGKGLRMLAQHNHHYARLFAEQCQTIKGVELCNWSFFNELTLKLSCCADEVVEHLAKAVKPVLIGIPASRLFPGRFSNLLLVAITECNSHEDIIRAVNALKKALS